MKKMQYALSFLLIPAFLLGSFAVSPQAMADDDENGNASFAITSVSPNEVSPSAATAITITGTGFTSGLAVGIAKEGNEISSTTGLTILTSVFVGATSMTATVPSGLVAGEYDLYVYDPSQSTFTFAKKEEAIECEVDVDSNVETLGYSNRKSARRKIDVTFTGIELTKKNWIKVRMNGKNVPILKVVSHTATATVLRLNVKYKGWAPGEYPLTLTYKKRVRNQYTSKKGSIKYRNEWERGSIIDNDFLTIMATP